MRLSVSWLTVARFRASWSAAMAENSDVTAQEIAKLVRQRLGANALEMCRLLVAIEEEGGHLAPGERVKLERALLRRGPT